MIVIGKPLGEAYKDLALKDFVETQGSFINPCHEDKPQKTEEIITTSGEKGIKAWYWVKEGCQGARERSLNDPYVFFDARPENNVLIEFFEGQMDEEFDSIVFSFKFIEPLEYGD